jgi:hypothetical protein
LKHRNLKIQEYDRMANVKQRTEKHKNFVKKVVWRDSRCSCCRLRTEGGVGRDEQEMFRLQDRMTLIPLVRNRTPTLIKREDDTRS